METTTNKVQIWKDSFKLVLGNEKAYKRRLKELNTWDKPLNSKSNDPGFKWAEWARKIQALEELILEEIEAECNECSWKGLKTEMINETIDDIDPPVLVCPKCKSENIYYFK